MRRLPFLALVCLATVAVPQAAAEPTALALDVDTVEVVDPASVITYQAALPAPGEVLAEPLSVTDEELSAVGASPDTAVTLSNSPPDFVVDAPPEIECPDADFASIQAAVTAAPPGSTILVCPGLYNEAVNIPKTLVLEGKGLQGLSTQCPPQPADPYSEPVVQFNSIFGIFQLQANNIVLEGFRVRNNSAGPGIFSSALFSGYEIRRNTVELNVFGLYANSSGLTQMVVEENCFRHNNQAGSASGDGIYSDQGLENAVIEENYFTGHDSASIVLALNQEDITITHNDMINDNTIVLVDTDDALVSYNQVKTAGGSGIFLGGNVTDTVIEYNKIDHPGGTGITTNAAFTGTPNLHLTIQRNHVVGSPFDGIRLNFTTTSLVASNRVEFNDRDGIRLQNNSDNNTVRDNTSRSNFRDGMRVDADGSSSNLIERNKMSGNGEHDCHDDTVGAGTAGTANFWIQDMGKTENRPGLCRNATVTP